jgi:CheY-like chemotaxis protein
VGIPQEYLDVIFEPFHRLSSTKNTVEGTGIGLVVVKRLMAQMNGEVRVESDAGGGSTFTLLVPVAENGVTLHEEHLNDLLSRSNRKPTEGERKVLYIEDNPANLNLVERIISRIPGLYLIVASQGSVGVDLAIAHRPALILVDINLPDIDGYEVLRRLKRVEDLSGSTMVALSANAMKKDIDKGLQLGFADYITKPIDVARFIEIVNRYT